MKDTLRLPDYLEHMLQAANQALEFVDGMDETAFAADRRTQQAAIFNLLVLGEAAGNVLAVDPVFAAQHPELPWRVIRATRNRLMHGYFDLNLTVVWGTIQNELPALLQMLPTMLAAARAQSAGPPPPTAAS
ncbi:DUF86 domain-containing protein [Pseudorhodoferax sp. LjRoot39]|uniref:HepT-like ribonuclease domain-containing protein n=1 Tax=Pseudorhodoferax sp. LjRoot39 TaxID=3342328 RepID=UPI003ECD50EC